MLDHYSHIRMAAKRQAVDALEELWKKDAEPVAPAEEPEAVQ
jgi:hypothetical protein